MLAVESKKEAVSIQCFVAMSVWIELDMGCAKGMWGVHTSHLISNVFPKVGPVVVSGL